MGSNKRDAFFQAIETENLKTLRWSLQHGGMSVTHPHNDENLPPLHVAVKLGKPKSLKALLESVDLTRDQAAVDVPDHTHGDRTALMLAAAGNWMEGCEMLLKSGASLTVKDEKGRTAADYAKLKNRTKIVEFFAEYEKRQTVQVSDETELDAETRKLNKLQLEAEQRGISVDKLKQEKEQRAVEEKKSRDEKSVKEAEVEKNRKLVASQAAWEEVRRAATDQLYDLSVPDATKYPGSFDEAIYLSIWLKTINIRKLSAGMNALPIKVFQLKSLNELILRDCGIAELPEDLGKELSQLRVLDIENNQVSKLPDSLHELPHLELLNVNHNKLTSLHQVEKCSYLVTLKAGWNQLKTLDLDLSTLPRLEALLVESNQLGELPSEIGELNNLVELNIADNNIEELPSELGNLNPKKFLKIELQGNPIRDKKIFRTLEKGAKPMKELLGYLQKQKSRGGKKGSNKKSKKEETESEEEQEDGSGAGAAQ